MSREKATRVFGAIASFLVSRACQQYFLLIVFGLIMASLFSSIGFSTASVEFWSAFFLMYFYGFFREYIGEDEDYQGDEQ